MFRTNFNRNYPFDPMRAWDFTPFLEKLKGISIYYGLSIDDESSENDNNFKVKINLETPNFIYNYDTYREFIKYDLILHLCPFTCEYLNKKYDTNKYKTIFWPIEPYLVDINSERTIDVFYTGHKISLHPINIMYNIMNKYIGANTINTLNNKISIKSIHGYYNKLDILNNTKICLIHNVLLDVTHFPGYTNYINDPLCKETMPWHNTSELVPQLKSRVFEGALMGCILLVFKDKYNIIEKYFEENIDFIYFDSEDDLDKKVKNILDNYDTYKHIAKNARNKVLNKYLVKNLVDFILENK